MNNGWGGRVNYTYSRLKDNQFGETNFFSANSAEAQNAYDLEAEYAVGLLDVPHKLVFSPIVELPFGEGKRWATEGIAEKILGNWTLSSIIAFESGFPLSVRAQHQHHRPLHPHAVGERRLGRSGHRRQPRPTACSPACG